MTNTYLSIVTLDIHRLNATIKRHRMSEWIKKKKKEAHLYAAYKRLIFDMMTPAD